MKKVAAYILMLCLMNQMFLAAGFMIDYYADIESYVAQCVNKDKPSLQCDGQCLLSEKIAATQQANHTDQSVNINFNVEYLAGVFQMQSMSFPARSTHGNPIDALYISQPATSLDKPPIFG